MKLIRFPKKERVEVIEKMWDKVDDLPLISIGMPIYNSEDTIEDAIVSIINQDYKNFELIISDNSSKDRTGDICQSFVDKDSRISYHRQTVNIGPTANFEFVLSMSSGDFFMWAAGDDTRSPDFLTANLRVLLDNPNFVASTSPNIFDQASNSIHEEVKVALLGSRSSRFEKFLHNPNQTHGLFYSLMRTEAIKSCPWIKELIFGWDWAIVLYLANQGEINRTETARISFGIKGFSRQENIYKAHGLKGSKRIFPYLILSQRIISLIKTWPKKESFSIYWRVIWLNLRTLFLEYRLVRYFLGDVKVLIKRKVNLLFGSRP